MAGLLCEEVCTQLLCTQEIFGGIDKEEWAHQVRRIKITFLYTLLQIKYTAWPLSEILAKTKECHAFNGMFETYIH